MLGSWRKLGTAATLAVVLAGCSSVLTPPPPAVSGQAALEALKRGDYAAAEAEASNAVKQNPSDPTALIALGLTYELTNRPQQAIEYYQVVLALKPDGTVVLADGIERRLADVARVRLANLAEVEAPPPAPALTAEQGWGNAAKRFIVLRRLVEAGLATESEYQTRRKENMGALLPYSEAPPGPGLEQPPPGFETVAERLQALGGSLERKAINPREHALERVTILDALLPANPRQRAEAPPPMDPLVAPAYLSHLQKLRADGLISAEQQSRERAAVERHAGPASVSHATASVSHATVSPSHATVSPSHATVSPSRAAVSAAPAPMAPKVAPAPAKPSKPAAGQPLPLAKPGSGAKPAAPAPAAAAAGGHAVQLGAFASAQAAMESWKRLSAKHPELARLQPKVSAVDLGPKGVFHRLKAGPMASDQAAKTLCAAIKQRKDDCVATFY